MGIFSRSKPHPETLARLQDYDENYGLVLECNTYIAEKIGFHTSAKACRDQASVIARFIRIARSSNDEKACEILATFESDFKEHIDMAENLQKLYRSDFGKDFDPGEVVAAKESGWRLI